MEYPRYEALNDTPVVFLCTRCKEIKPHIKSWDTISKTCPICVSCHLYSEGLKERAKFLKKKYEELQLFKK